MKTYRFDVVVIGAGPAGVAAAGALAGSGISVAVIEAGVYAGAENWSGCAYYAENLAEKDCFGREAVEAAPFERRVVRRGTLVHNGLDVVGVELTDPKSFQNCYTVLRPVYDPYFAALAQAKGAILIAGTTVTSLLRKAGRVTGVETSRGPLYAEVVFIAEGDASHLIRSENLERHPRPHYLQGVKAVLSLPAAEIEQRFRLNPGEGAAYEILVRNASLAGRTAHLNAGVFLYTNKDSLSLGYVVPLDNLKKHYRGDHSHLLEWMKSLPYIGDFVKDARLSAYGTKIIRGGGWRERPVLVEDGLAVGGASVGLGVDIPFPNYTGPASATGLYFARAIKGLLKAGKSPDAKNLTRAYVNPLRESVYGQNARYLSRWPGYFGRSRVLFGRTADMLCGTAHFLSSGSLRETGRFLRKHLLSFRAFQESLMDALSAVSALRLWKPLLRTSLNPATFLHWLGNQVRKTPLRDQRLGIIMNISGKEIDFESLPRPIAGLIRRVSPALSRAIGEVYANDPKPAEQKLGEAVRVLLRSFRLTDFIALPLFGLALLLLSLGTALWDAFRFYVLKTPVEKLLAEPVMAYQESQRKTRDLDAVKPSLSLEAKLALNTYRLGSASHIRTLWPEPVVSQPDMAKASLWWVCPARVYGYDAPLVGRGRVTVNFENCIKCETCWRAEPEQVLWGRFTEHKLIYRPESAAIAQLLTSVQATSAAVPVAALPRTGEETLWYVGPEIKRSAASVLHAAAAFRDAVAKLPASADAGRRAWPAGLGSRLAETLSRLEAAFTNDGRRDAAKEVQAEGKALELRVAEGRFFHALYCSLRTEQRVRFWIGQSKGDEQASEKVVAALAYGDVSQLFPDRVVKQWEEGPLPEEWAEKLRTFIREHQHPARPAIRALSCVSPALGLIAACQMRADRILKSAGREPLSGLCAVSAEGLEIRETETDARIKGLLSLVPLAAGTALLVIAREKAYLVPLKAAGVFVTPTPAIGFRAAGLSDVALDCTVKKEDIIPAQEAGAHDPGSYLAIALGAGDYLALRVKEHAAGRVQFPGQMLDTEGRDGIAKLGAVKAMIAKIEAWRLGLETLYQAVQEAHGSAQDDFLTLCAALSATAYGPEPGCMAYEAGQVFGGFAYSEDDLLSRFYRDSSLFRFLDPGYGAAERLRAALAEADLEHAFSRELGSLTKAGKPLDSLVQHWREIKKKYGALPESVDRTLAGEAAAVLLACRGIISRVEAALESGTAQEAEAAAAEVLLGLAGAAVMQAALSAGRGAVSPTDIFPLSPQGRPANLDVHYDRFCTRPGAPHRSGSFLVTVFDRSPRYVPEMQLHDVRLRTRWNELVTWFRENVSNARFDGLPLERSIEKFHRLPESIITAVKEKRWLATYIPRSEDGLGWRKAEYYLLNAAAGSFGDAGICLLIMASTSIGTTPILLGLDEELPRVREELAPLTQDPKRLGEIGRRIKRIIASFRNPNPGRIRKEYEAVMRLVDSRIRRTRVVKYLAANFLRAFYGAGIAGRRGDFGEFTANLARAGELFERLMPDVRAALDELPRRERCHRLFLRALGHGAVSAFALTEPTAGSDSGGVTTTAVLKSARLMPVADGRYAFSLAPNDPKSLRYLVDAERILFIESGMACRMPDGSAAPIKYDRYDYAADQGVRSYTYEGKDCPFHDIGQVRRQGSELVYEYYSLTGAKMWITNGSIATQFCLYAQTREGVTGFIVDRHAEGLKVGADEKKTGQRGSPTNEIALDSVRVPREAVIGYEGHGQVNALETLNVGRCGLAVVSGSLMHKLMDEALRSTPPSPERDRLLGEAAAILFGSESLAYYLVGLFDRPHESVRMESAIAKFACSEDIHRLISLLERAYGPAGQTEKHLLEKARRDARILTIYEGTNEVQRFLILKDLISQAGDWPELPEKIHERPGDSTAETLAKGKNRLRSHVKAAAALLGDTAWSDAMLQPGLFLLAEMACELLRAECIFYRLAWIEERKDLFGPEFLEFDASYCCGIPATQKSAPQDTTYAGALLRAGRRAAEIALARLGHLDEQYWSAWQQVQKNLDTPEVRAADAALDRAAEKEAPRPPMPGAVTAPLKILCILRTVAELSPSPRLAEGRIEEIVWKPNDLDRAGLDQALALKAAGPNVTVDVLMAGRPEHGHLLRTTAGAADHLILLQTEDGPSPGDVSEAVRNQETAGGYDLIIIGAESPDGDPVLGPYLAGSLKRPYHPLDRIAAQPDGTGIEGASLPAVIGITRSSAAPDAPISTLLDSLSRTVKVHGPGQGGRPGSAVQFRKPAGGAAAIETITTAAGAAAYLKAYATALSAATAEPYAGAIGKAALSEGAAVWALLDPVSPKANLAAVRACRTAAEFFGKKACAVIAAPGKQWPGLLGLAKANGADSAFCLDTNEGVLSEDGKQDVLRLIRKASGAPLVFAGTAWNEALGKMAGESANSPDPGRIATGVMEIRKHHAGFLLLSSPVYEGRLIRQERLTDGAAFVSLAEEAELPPGGTRDAFAPFVLDFALEPEQTRPLPPPAEQTLSRAEVIIDLGYGVRDRSGMELAQELKARLAALGVAPLFGATRKVTQDLKLLPLDAQIGQTGVRVNPRLIIALGVSGAPQHVDWIGARAEVLCFNKDPEAPLMKLGQTRPAPPVHPIPGDLFVTVRELIQGLS